MNVELELKNGKRRKFHPQVANFLIRRGLGVEVQAQAATYLTRDMRASDSVRHFEPQGDSADDAPYGLKADGTPRKRPGRSKAEE